MKVSRMVPLSILLLLSAVSHNALAVNVSVSITGAGPVTYFPGEVQESTVTFGGGGPISTNLRPGVPFVVDAHSAMFDIGLHDGATFGPAETRRAETTYEVTSSSGTESVTVSQEATLFQIANNQFQFDLTPSNTETIDLGAAGYLDVTAFPVVIQLFAGSSGSSALIRTRFVLRTEPQPIAGTVTGTALTDVVCFNVNNGSHVVISPDKRRSWDCSEAGLSADSGDGIIQGLIGRAE